MPTREDSLESREPLSSELDEVPCEAHVPSVERPLDALMAEA